MRRFEKRMQAVGLNTYGTTAVPRAEPREFAELFDTILINVTGFFRDPEAWVPRQGGHPEGPGASRRREEPRVVGGVRDRRGGYTVAILLAEALGDEGFRSPAKIYATDVDDDALPAGARRSTRRSWKSVPEELRGSTSRQPQLTVRNDLRRAVIFGRNDLLQDPPISRVDLLICRNTLMYFDAEAQDRILANFLLRAPAGWVPDGRQGRGAASRTTSLPAADLKRRVFVKNTAGRSTARRKQSERVRAGGRRMPEEGFEHGPSRRWCSTRKGGSCR